MDGGIELGFEIWLYRYAMIDLDGNNKVWKKNFHFMSADVLAAY